VKSGSSSAVAFGRVLQAVRKRSSKNQADVAGSLSPPLSVAAVSMAESGSRPPKTEAMLRGYAAALELDDDGLVELWWAMQGMVEVEDPAEERPVQRWWRQMRSDDLDVALDYHQAVMKAKRARTPNEATYAPSLELFGLAESICVILRRLLGDSWKVRYKSEMGLREPIDGRLAAVMIELLAGDSEESGSNESLELMATFACPEPVARPVPPGATTRPKAEAISPDVAWILSSVEAMPARERAAVAGFIRGLREGASLFSEVPLLTALDKTFDERREYFRRLFDDLDSALVSGAEDAAARVADILAGITDLAKTSPFKDLKSPEIVVQEFPQSGRAIER
jgi:hypothetical protein